MRRMLLAAGIAFALLGTGLGAALFAGTFRRETARAGGRVVQTGATSRYNFLHRHQVFVGTVEGTLPVGTDVHVFYDPDDPSRHHATADGSPPDVRLDAGTRAPAVIAVFALAIGLGFLVAAFRLNATVALLLLAGACRRASPPAPAPVLEIVEPAGPVEVEKGSSVRVVARQKGGAPLSEAWLEVRGAERSRMARLPSGDFAVEVAIGGDTAVRIAAATPAPWLEIRTRRNAGPVLLSARISYPEYIGWPAAVKPAGDLAQGVPIGSRIRIVADGGPLEEVRADGAAVAGEFEVTRESHRVEVRAGGTTSSFTVCGRPDRPPVVTPMRPARDLIVTPDALIPVEARADDDYGVVEVRIRIVRGNDVLIDRVLSGPATVTPTGAKARDKLALRFTARDAKQETSSREFRLRVVNREEAASGHDTARRVLRDSLLRQAKAPAEIHVLELAEQLRLLREEAEMNRLLDDAMRERLDRAGRAIDAAMKTADAAGAASLLEEAAGALE
ncbi:MAG: hypothetical protein HYY17_11450 [Planctomycetes bacterium]|nr:hypothetical protein [Planctomycetota bacterium]